MPRFIIAFEKMAACKYKMKRARIKNEEFNNDNNHALLLFKYNQVRYKSHKTCATDKPCTPQTPPPSTSGTERGKTPSERTTCCCKQRNQQKAHKAAGQTSSQTSATSQQKVMTTKTAVPAKQTPPAHQSDSHHSHHESHSRDDRHRKETQQAHTTSHDSHQHECCTDALPHHTQTEQMPQVHSTGFYEEALLQHHAEIQKCLEALKNPPKPVFKVSLPPPPQMDVEPATSSSTSLPPTATSLPPTAPTSATATTVTHTTSLPPTAPMSVQTTTPAQPSLVIMSRLVLGAAPQTNTAQQQQPPISPDVTGLILRWVAGLWAEELGVVDAVHTAYLALFLYEVQGLDNPSCLLQAYDTAVSLIDSWMAYPQYSPFEQPPEIADIQ
uniref:Uncharacterized protein n=1 Tax=Romanomermis culicivorax TaxID=13658 RepID=A0A915JZ06_ROMCU